MYLNYFLSFFILGLLFGVIFIPVAYLWHKRRKFGKKYGYKRGILGNEPRADKSVLNYGKTDHSAENF